MDKVMANLTTQMNVTFNRSEEIVYFIAKCPLLFSKSTEVEKLPLTETLITTSTIIGIINCIAALPTIIVNVLVIVAILRTNNLRNIANITLLNVLVINALNGVLCLPLFGALLINRPSRRSACTEKYIVHYTGASFSFISMLSVMLIAIERYIAVLHPFKYDNVFTMAKVLKYTSGIWAFSLISGLLLFTEVTKGVGITIAGLITVSSYIVNVIAYYRIFKELHRMLHVVPANVPSQTGQNDERQRKERRIAKFTAYIIFFLLVSYLPLFIYEITFTVKRNEFLNMVAFTIMLLHASLSPFLFIWQSPPISRAILRIFCRNPPQIGNEP